MRKSSNLADRICLQCGKQYTPNGTAQMYCLECRQIRTKETKLKYYRKKNPNAKPKVKCEDVCCICGSPFGSHFDGKPYCNKHYLRMKYNGTPELKGKSNTNVFTVDGDVLRIRTKNGAEILADASDYDLLKKHSWCVSSQGYAVANIHKKAVKMNRFLYGDDCAGYIVDHINRDKLDNRRSNLRLCDMTGNARNSTMPFSSKAPYIGVRKTETGRYSARIMVNRKQVTLGTFDSLEEAIEARRAGEDKCFGEYANYKGSEALATRPDRKDSILKEATPPQSEIEEDSSEKSS